MHGCPKRAWSDGVAAARAPRHELAPRFRQAHLESGHDAADPLLEVPEAHAVRTRSMRTLRLCVRRWHRRGIREGPQIAVSYDVDDQGLLHPAEAHAPRDRGGSPSRQRPHELPPRTAPAERILPPPPAIPDRP